MGNIRYAAQNLIRKEDGPPQAVCHALWADYETDPEIVAAVLPPPLAPTAEPRVHLNICNGETDSGHRFGAGNFTVRARHGNVDGEYCLALQMDTDAAVFGGRERWGEPKKVANIVVTRDGDDVCGTVTRHGVAYLELRGRVVETLAPPPPKHTLDFYHKFMISPDGKDFDRDPDLVYCRRTYWISKMERVEGEVILRDSPFDPVADIAVRRLLSFHFVEYQSDQRGEIVGSVPRAEFRPFAHQRYDTFAWSG